MKKTITAIIILLISLNLSAQSKDSIPKGSDTYDRTSVSINDSIPILSVKDINNYMQQLSNSNVFTPSQFSQFMQVLSQMVATKQKELQQPKKK